MSAVISLNLQGNLTTNLRDAAKSASALEATMDKLSRTVSNVKFDFGGAGFAKLKAVSEAIEKLKGAKITLDFNQAVFTRLERAVTGKKLTLDTTEAVKQFNKLKQKLDSLVQKDLRIQVSFAAHDANLKKINNIRDLLNKPITVKVKFEAEGNAVTAGAAALHFEALVKQAEANLAQVKAEIERARTLLNQERTAPKPTQRKDSADPTANLTAGSISEFASFEATTVNLAREAITKLHGETGILTKLNQELVRRFDVLKDTIFEVGGTAKDYARIIDTATKASQEHGVELGLTIRLAERLIDETEDLAKANEHLARATQLTKNKLDDASGVAVTYAAVLRGEAGALRSLGPQYAEKVKYLEQIDNRQVRVAKSLELIDRWNKEQETALKTAPSLIDRLNGEYAVFAGSVRQAIANIGPFGRAVAVSAAAALAGVLLLVRQVKQAVEEMIASYTSLDREAKGRVEAVRRQFTLLEAEILLAVVGGEEGFNRLSTAALKFAKDLRAIVSENKEVFENLGKLLGFVATKVVQTALGFTVLTGGVVFLGEAVFDLAQSFNLLFEFTGRAGFALAEALDKGLSPLDALKKAFDETRESADKLFNFDNSKAVRGLADALMGMLNGGDGSTTFDIVYDDEAVQLFMNKVEHLLSLDQERLAVKRALRSEDERSLLNAVKERREREAGFAAQLNTLRQQKEEARRLDEDLLKTGGGDPYLQDKGKATKALDEKIRQTEANLKLAQEGIKELEKQYTRVLAVNEKYRQDLVQLGVTAKTFEDEAALAKVFSVEDVAREVDDLTVKLDNVVAINEETLRIERERIGALRSQGVDVDDLTSALAQQTRELQAQEDTLRNTRDLTQQRLDLLRQLDDVQLIEAQYALQRKVDDLTESAQARNRLSSLYAQVEYEEKVLRLKAAQLLEQQQILGVADDSLRVELEAGSRRLALLREEGALLATKARKLSDIEETYARENALLAARSRIRTEADRFSLSDLRAQRREVDDRLTGNLAQEKLLIREASERRAAGLDTASIDQQLRDLQLTIQLDAATAKQLEDWPLTFGQTVGVALYEVFEFGADVLGQQAGRFADAVSEIGEQGQEARRGLEEGFENSLSDIGAAAGASGLGAINPALAPIGAVGGGIIGALFERFWDTESEKRQREEEARRKAEEAARAAQERHRELTALFKESLRLQGRTADNTTQFLNDRADVQDVRLLVNTLRNEGRLY